MICNNVAMDNKKVKMTIKEIKWSEGMKRIEPGKITSSQSPKSSYSDAWCYIGKPLTRKDRTIAFHKIDYDPAFPESKITQTPMDIGVWD
jgi:hypothetical protein